MELFMLGLAGWALIGGMYGVYTYTKTKNTDVAFVAGFLWPIDIVVRIDEWLSKNAAGRR